MVEPAASIERTGRTAVVHLRGDVVVGTASALDAVLRELRERDTLDEIRLDFTNVDRVDSAAVAVIEVARRGGGARIALERLDARQRALFDVLAPAERAPRGDAERIGMLEQIGGHIFAAGRSLRELGSLVVECVRVTARVIVRRARLPAGSVGTQVVQMGSNAVGIVSLLSFLLGMSFAFQGAVQLRHYGAGPFVADLVALGMVREFAPFVAAIIVAGRTGAAIAAELGTMRVDAELDAMNAMGISPVRYLVVPRLLALSITGPILTLMAMFVGIGGGMVVALMVLRMSPQAFWVRAADQLDLGDFAKGLAKSLAFAWIIGLAGAHLGLRARRGASGVGAAATRAVVAAVFGIICFDAAFEAALTLARQSR
ncbi:MAG TPA: ABC transporter permease [Kofleriaceae bacterium]|nr:ABC transporter permease [Kofleriaceae bacterium]